MLNCRMALTTDLYCNRWRSLNRSVSPSQRAVACNCRQALLPRDRKATPEMQCFSTAPVQCVTLTAQSGKVTHAALSICTRKLNCVSAWRDSDTAFSGHFTHKENMNRYRRGTGTVRGITRWRGRLLREHNRSPTTPQRQPPRRSGIVRSPDKTQGLSAYAPGKSVLVLVRICGIHERGNVWEYWSKK